MRLQDQKGIGWLGLLACVLAALACNFPIHDLTAVPSATATPARVVPASPLPATNAPSPTPTIQLPYDDASPILTGVCFNFLQTLAGQTIVLNSPAELAAFYNRVNQSKQCRDVATPQPFDFDARQIVGAVVTGKGCQIDAQFDRIDTDAAARQRRIIFQAAPVGDCPYDLVRPLWLAMARPPDGYTTIIQLASTS
ncbi:MAG: hypothetical protein IT324_21945 [Anaerolineae bacterium]|nr:hypothetical protein [Anaerolineae bacterium]